MSFGKAVGFIERIDELRTRGALISELEMVLESYGFQYYGLLRKPKPSEAPMDLVLAGRWPQGWPERYISRKYVLVDPTVRYLNRSRGGFRWAESFEAYRSDPHRRRMEQMMREAQKFGLEDGYIFPVHAERGLVGNLTIGGTGRSLKKPDMIILGAIAKTAFWHLVDLDRLARGEPRPEQLDFSLTKREMEALSYLADGMTSPEIAEVLKISNHTVDWYMNRLQDKLRAHNRHHAVAIAFRLGLLS